MPPKTAVRIVADDRAALRAGLQALLALVEQMTDDSELDPGARMVFGGTRAEQAAALARLLADMELADMEAGTIS